MTVLLPGSHYLLDTADTGVQVAVGAVADLVTVKVPSIHPDLRALARASMLRQAYRLPGTGRCVDGPGHDEAMSELSDAWAAQRALARPLRTGGPLRAIFAWPPADLLALANLPPVVATGLAQAALVPRPALGKVHRERLRVICVRALGDRVAGQQTARVLVDALAETVGPVEGRSRDLTVRPTGERATAAWAWQDLVPDLPGELRDAELVWGRIVIGAEVWAALGAAGTLLAA